MASSKFGVKTREWHQHLRNRFGTKRPQEKLVRADSKKKCRDIGDIVKGYSRYREE